MLSIDSNGPNDKALSPALLEEQAESNIVLAPEDIATLTSLMHRYDDLLLQVDELTERLEFLLESESPSQKSSS